MTVESLTSALPAAWRVFRTPPASGAYNMAVDSALLDAAPQAACGVWRTYSWERPTVSFGRHEIVRGRFDASSLARAAVDGVRRPTGGRALLHSAEVTYSVAVPVSSRVPWPQLYGEINAILLEALLMLGVAATLAPASARPPRPSDGTLCFDEPSMGEIVFGDRKLVGSAVWRTRGAYLQHGSILLQDHQTRLVNAMLPPHDTHEAPPPAATLEEVLGVSPSWERVADALERAVHQTVTRRTEGIVLTDPPVLDRHAVSAHEEWYRTPSWLWRR
jgi:lipoate-protein ligase A